jgi:D-threo-aldose 1-dehydrogenase
MDPLARRRLGLTAVEVTQLGFGGAGLGDLFEVIPEAQAAATLEAAGTPASATTTPHPGTA